MSGKAEDAYVKVTRIVYVLGDMLSQGARDALANCLDIVWMHMTTDERKNAGERLKALGSEALHFDDGLSQCDSCDSCDDDN